jgi:hypothetical protein
MVSVPFSDHCQPLVDEIVALFVERKNAEVVLVPHVFGTHDESYSQACEDVYRSLSEKYPGRLGLLRGFYDQQEIKHIIGGFDFFVGACMRALQRFPSRCLQSASRTAGRSVA